MELTILFFIFVLLLGVYLLVKSRRRINIQEVKPKYSPYSYTRKNYIMTRAESDMFRRLERIAGAKYYVFPQIHLSSLLNHAINGQDWRAALAKIQRKSVDFVLVNRETMMTSYVIELDDKTHDTSAARIVRDNLVDEIFLDAGVPLVRLRNVHEMSDEDIIDTLPSTAIDSVAE